MIGQMSIFDWMPTLAPTAPDINVITEEECARIIGERIGVRFTYNSKFKYWEARIGKLMLTMEYSNYMLDGNHSRFIGTGWKKGTSGGGAPRDNIDEAVSWYERKVNEWATKY